MWRVLLKGMLYGFCGLLFSYIVEACIKFFENEQVSRTEHVILFFVGYIFIKVTMEGREKRWHI